MDVVSDAYTHLGAQGIAGGATGWDLLRRRKTDAPVKDQVVVVTEDGGPEPEIPASVGIGDAALVDVGVQFLVRAQAWDGDASESKAQEIYDALHGQLDVVIGAHTYLRVRARTPEPLFLGFDEQGRPEHSIAFLFLAQVGSA